MAATAKAEVFLENVGSDICCPFFDSKGTLHFILKDAGEIYELKNGSEMKLVHTTSGEATGAGFDANGMIYCTDLAHTAVLVARTARLRLSRFAAVGCGRGLSACRRCST